MPFKIEPISPDRAHKMKTTGTWKPESPVSLERLREVFVDYQTFDGTTKEGSIVVLDVISPYVEKTFRELLNQSFLFANVTPIDEYGGNDDNSMEANNSSAFNYRPIAGTSTLSLHSYGIAIDINPIQNPFIKNAAPHPQKKCSLVEVWPSQGHEFLNRINLRPGMVESIVNVFHRNAFRSWGGRWNNPIDLHHFEIHRNIATFLVAVSPERGEKFLEEYVSQELDLDHVDFLASI